MQPRALVVDDSQDNADTLGRLMSMCGAEVRVAYDGRTGLQIATTFLPHVALLDLAMPSLDGLSLGRQFRENESLRKTHLVAVSGYADGEHQAQATQAGFDRYLVKPFSVEQVQAILADVRAVVAQSQELLSRARQLQESAERSLATLDGALEQSREAIARSVELRHRRISRGATFFAALDQAGTIKVISKAWRACYKEPWLGVGFSEGTNYLLAAQMSNDPVGRQIAAAIEEVLAGRQSDLKLELEFNGRPFTFQAVADKSGAFIVFKDRAPRQGR
jgi:CheY-like chemotaxis protein